MATLGELMVKIGADFSDFTKGMSKVNASMETTGKNMSAGFKDSEKTASSSFAGIGKSLKGVGLAMAGAFAVQGITSFGKTMVTTTADIQALQSQYTQVMGGMKSQTDKYLNDMATTWNKHPNELKSAYTQYVAILKGKGVAEKQAHELSKQYLERTVDANAFSNESMETTTERFMAGIKGEYDSLDTAMVNLSATMLDDKAQKKYGKSFNDLSVAQQEQLKVQEALRQHTSAGVFGQGEREANSYQNNLANLKNTWTELMAQMGSPVLEIVNKGLQGLTQVISSINFDGVKSQLSGLWQAFQNTSVFSTMITIFQTIKPLIMSALSDIVTFIQTQFSTISAFIGANGGQILQAVSNVWNGILAVINFVMPAVLFVIQYVWGAIKGVISGALDVIMGLVKIFAGLFTGDFSAMWEGIKQLFSGAIKLIWNLMSLSFVGSLRKIVVSLAKGLWKTISSMWDDIVIKFLYGKDKVVAVWNGIKSFASSIWGGIKSVVVSLAKGLWNGVKGVFSSLKSGISSIWNSVKSFTVNAWNSMKSRVTSLASSLKNGVVNAWNAVKSRTSSIWNSVKTAMTHPVETAKNTISGIISKIKGFFSGLHLKIPKIGMPPLPHFNLSGKFSLKPPSVPKLSVSWYKTGGIATGASVVGVGEAGAEAIVPLSQKNRMKPFAEAVASFMPDNVINGQDGQLIVDNTVTTVIELDGEVVAKKTAKYMKPAIEKIERNRSRLGGVN
ncbi:phage tail protein [Rummeliibacillus suwonensis]|uniref:phage tail protein n=1 Tax=Rummeliibacillus suwonensis TaxID=1306154 RepID=UPI001AB01898|nr:hypothetical protein [Rummeliibacillus suwonensis]MBO2536297.1 hypothetical protein [Rummeliibacillus suwonensis]